MWDLLFSLAAYGVVSYQCFDSLCEYCAWQNKHFPSDWSSFLQTVVGRVGTGDENESSILFQLITSIVESGQQNIAMHVPGIVSAIASALSYLIPPIPKPWPQVSYFRGLRDPFFIPVFGLSVKIISLNIFSQINTKK